MARVQTKLYKCDHSIFYIVYSTHVKALAPVVQRADNSIQRIKFSPTNTFCPPDSATYPLDRVIRSSKLVPGAYVHKVVLVFMKTEISK